MARTGSSWRHVTPPAVGVLLGAVAGLLTNIVSGGHARLPVIVALVATVLLWAGWEGWRAVRAARAEPPEAAPPAAAAVTVRSEQVLGQVDGEVTGIRASAGPGDYRATQKVDRVESGGSVTGVDLTGRQP